MLSTLLPIWRVCTAICACSQGVGLITRRSDQEDAEGKSSDLSQGMSPSGPVAQAAHKESMHHMGRTYVVKAAPSARANIAHRTACPPRIRTERADGHGRPAQQHPTRQPQRPRPSLFLRPPQPIASISSEAGRAMRTPEL